MAWQHHIVCDPRIMLGKPVIRGTRITVEIILEDFAAGATVENILESYPHLTREQILAAVEYAGKALAGDEQVMLTEASG